MSLRGPSEERCLLFDSFNIQCVCAGVFSGLVVRLFPTGHASSRVNFWVFYLSYAMPSQIADAAKVAKEAF